MCFCLINRTIDSRHNPESATAGPNTLGTNLKFVLNLTKVVASIVVDLNDLIKRIAVLNEVTNANK